MPGNRWIDLRDCCDNIGEVSPPYPYSSFVPQEVLCNAPLF
jgi:hypothetical protein